MIRLKARLRLAARKLEIAFFVSLIAYILAALSLFIVPEDILSAHADFRDFTAFMADFYPAINVAQTKTAFGDVASFHLSYLYFFMLVCLLFAGLYGVAKGATGRLEENKNNAQALSQGIILFALIVCFLIFGGLDDFYSGYSIWHSYRPTREFIAQMRLELFSYYEMIGFGIANFCVMISAYLIVQICRQLLAFVSLRARQTTAFFGRIFGRR
ncbi:hypothetical protein [uncultured Campylobacter sp.]|uniref:hypothetical protein n=1 Tax=uncultured Campylobacter sp. TaxID=218934 RepID=UPI002622B195|nr:hypothetical protein [uncultured Campylobacter sp.]